MECVFCKTVVGCELIEISGIYAIICPIHGRYALNRPSHIDSIFKQAEHVEDKRKCEQLLFEYNQKNSIPILLCADNYVQVDGYYAIWLHEFMATFPQEAGEMLERAFYNIIKTLKHPADTFVFSEKSNNLLFARDLSDSEYIVKQFLDLGFLYKSEHPNIFPTPLKVTAKGWEYYNQIKSKPLGHSAQVFVAMWFDENRRVYYEQGIKPAIEDSTNFKCIRVDTVQHNNKICDQIIAEIRKSKFMVADFTGDRSGVYYEAAFAQGLGIPVIWVVDETDVKNLHFDTRQYNHITYKDAEDLRLKLRARIEATIV